MTRKKQIEKSILNPLYKQFLTENKKEPIPGTKNFKSHVNYMNWVSKRNESK